jgi:hypothetical protein
MRALPVKRFLFFPKRPEKPIFRYTPSIRMEDRATLESDLSANPVAGMAGEAPRQPSKSIS